MTKVEALDESRKERRAKGCERQYRVCMSLLRNEGNCNRRLNKCIMGE